MGILSRLFDDNPRPGTPTQTSVSAPASANDDSTPVLRRKHAEVITEINRCGADLPPVGTVLARRVTDAVGAILARDDVDTIDVHARIAINAMLSDYLPNAIGTYVAAARAGRHDVPVLVEQLDALHDSAVSVLAATQAHDLTALETQSMFLRTKFTKSDLDL